VARTVQESMPSRIVAVDGQLFPYALRKSSRLRGSCPADQERPLPAVDVLCFDFEGVSQSECSDR